MVRLEKITFCILTSPSVTDNNPPVITNCPGRMQVSAPFGSASAVVTWTEPTASDDSGFVQQTLRTHSPGSVFNAGTTTVRYIYEDGSGNTAECMFDVVVTGKF